MKVLMVSKALVTATYRQKIAELSRLGVEMVIVVPTEWREGGRAQRLEPGADDGYRMLPHVVKWNGHFHLHYYPGLSAILREEKPDLVHVDEEPYNAATFLGVQAARKSNLPVVFYAWQNLARTYPPPFSWMERVVYRWASGGLAVSHEAEQVLRKKGYRGRLFVVPGFGVDPDRFSPGSGSPSRFTIGFPNRLVEAKGIWVLLKAMTQLPTDIRLGIVGDGPLRGEITGWIHEHNLESRISLTTRLPSCEMPDVLRSFSAVVLPSLTTPSWKEQFGRVLIEAMACGVPVIGSDSGEIPNVIGDAGLVVAEGDVNALAEAIKELYDQPALRTELAEKGRDHVLKCFTQGHIALQTLEAYRHILNERK